MYTKQMRLEYVLFLCFVFVLLISTYLNVQKPTLYQELIQKIIIRENWIKFPKLNISELDRTDDCHEEKRHVVLIKYSDTESSIVRNVLYRFGASRNLTSLLPSKETAIFEYFSRPWSTYLTLPQGKDHYDLLRSRAVYDKGEINRLFPPDRHLISILTNPLDQLESSLRYYHSSTFPDEDKVAQYLSNPYIFPLGIDRYINNSMAYELGVPREQFYNHSFVQSHIKKIDKEFSLVLIMENMDESLVLLKRLLCWDLKDIIYIRKTSKTNKSIVSRTQQEFEKLRKLQSANFIVYEYFEKRLQEKLKLSRGIKEEVLIFQEVLDAISDFCLNWFTGSSLIIPKSHWNKQFTFMKKDCSDLTLNSDEMFQRTLLRQYGQGFVHTLMLSKTIR